MPATSAKQGTSTPPMPATPLGWKAPAPGSVLAPRARSPAASPPKPPPQASVAAYATTELSPEDMRLLRQVQVQNQRLRQQLGFRDEEVVPEAEEAQRAHIGRLEQAIHQSFNLRAKLQNADKELATLGASISNLSKEEQLALTSGSMTPGAGPPSSGNVAAAEDFFSAEVKRQSEKVMGEIQEVTRANLEMIKEQDEKIKTLEKDVSVARRQHQQLSGQVNDRNSSLAMPATNDQLASLETELRDVLQTCQDIEAALGQEQQKKSEATSRIIQKLQTERDVLVEEIGSLRESLQKGKDPLADSEYVRPATSILVDEAGQLKAQLSREDDNSMQEQGALELQAEDLKSATKDYEKQLQRSLAEKETMEAELQELRETRDGAKAIEKECLELRERKETLTKAMGRCREMIKVYDQKITEQRNETDDMRRRVKDVVGAR